MRPVMVGTLHKAGALTLALALVGVGCVDGSGDEIGENGAGVEQEVQVNRGFADYSERAARYLEATASDDGTSALDWIAVAEMAIRGDEDALERLDEMSVEDFERSFEKIDDYEDTADFDLLYLMNLRIGYPDQLEPEVARAIDERILGFKYWYTDSTPGVLDNRWYWSENHRIIFHTLELLAGERFPEEVFEVPDGDGEEMTGEDHAERAKEFIHEWLDEKARYGFSEWHSDVYYQKDLTSLLTLVEYAEDPEIVDRATAMLDVFLFDLALHQVNGNVGVTHGRSYAKDKLRVADQDTFGALQVLFGLSEEPPGLGDPGAVLFSRAERYKLPAALWEVAHSPEQFEDLEHMGVEIDPEQPVEDDPQRADGLSYTDADMVPFWWERGALTPWQTVALTMETADRYDLWDTELFEQFKAVDEVTDGDPEAAIPLASALAPVINIALLSDVDTRTWRDDGVMLSSAVDYRPGQFGHQYHAWQATLGEDAIAFTTSPGNEPREGDRWEDGDLYWNGGVQPLSHQVGPAAVHVYRPVYESPGEGLLEAFNYLPLTHAFVPTETFDEVVQVPEPPESLPWGSWLFARSGDRYLGLWSWRPTTWEDHSGDGTPTGGLTEDFDLVAPGGADNVWVVEVGRKGEGPGRYEDFEQFREELTAATPRVAQEAPGADGLPGRFSVLYDSPGAGVLGVAPDGELTLDGETVEPDDEVRFDNPFTQVAVGEERMVIEAGEHTLEIDLSTGERSVS
ncbi:MAG: hypothetical protein M9942_03760 [Microthrixaceae bacterium]|nr:hypothetical protein [Microthrixaceae bacterium]